jgi:RING finger/CHY zinc finger protein 1
MHWHCFNELSQFDVRCPICKKTMLDVDDMREAWDGLQEDIDLQPLPPDQARVVDIYCNDCEKHDSNRRWHPLGVSCSDCRGFNTSIDTKMVGIEAHNFLAQLERR